jgi:hypothetical protein
MRICFVGNSHVASAKSGWDVVATAYPDVNPSFFGAISGVFADIAIEKGTLVAKSEVAKQYFRRTSGGRDTAVFEDYDLVVLFGMQFSLWSVLDLYDRFRWGDQNNREGNYEPVSTGYLHEIVKARLARSNAIRYRNEIKRGSDSPSPKIWIYPEPMPSQLILTTIPAQQTEYSALLFATLRLAAKWQDELSLSDAFSAGRAAFSDNEYFVFEQPPDTRDRHILTRQEYSKGSLAFGSRSIQKDDFVHANVRLGELIIRQILDRARADVGQSETVP